jgi:Zn-dependent protease with chaperone function
MDPDVLDTDMAVKGLAVLTAIPIVIFALWAEYTGRHIDRLSAGKGEFDRGVELARIKMAGICALIFQVTLFLGSGEIRETYPLISIFLLVSAIVLQGTVQAALERKLRATIQSPRAPALDANGNARRQEARPGEPGSERMKPGEQLEHAARAIFWAIAAAGLYVLVLMASVKAAMLIAGVSGAGPAGKNVLVILGAILGVLAGLIVNFALGPFHLRRILPTKPLGDPERRKLLESCFVRAGLPTPDLWVIDSEKLKFEATMMAGFRWLRPALFISRGALASLGLPELQAVVLREASHVSLSHLRKRFLLSFVLIVGTTFLATFVVLLGHELFPSLQPVIGPVAGGLALFFTFRTLGRQTRFHEFEADVHAIEKLGARLDDLVAALRKLDFLNELSLTQGLAHPSTELRIRRLNAHFAAQSLLHAASSEREGEDKAA